VQEWSCTCPNNRAYKFLSPVSYSICLGPSTTRVCRQTEILIRALALVTRAKGRDKTGHPRTETGRSKEAPALLQWHVFPPSTSGIWSRQSPLHPAFAPCFSLARCGGWPCPWPATATSCGFHTHTASLMVRRGWCRRVDDDKLTITNNDRRRVTACASIEFVRGFGWLSCARAVHFLV
jgi:hypothetical protein